MPQQAATPKLFRVPPPFPVRSMAGGLGSPAAGELCWALLLQIQVSKRCSAGSSGSLLTPLGAWAALLQVSC